MQRAKRPTPPEGAATTCIRHNVAYYETDAMGIVHHSNYVRFLELARVSFMAAHDRPYTEYVNEGFHIPVTRCLVHYLRACRFADPIDVTCWLSWTRSASLGFAYRLEVAGVLVATAESDHAITNLVGVPTRMPAHMRERVAGWLGQTA
jgi:acyl-CoA thioester hydrolase